MRWYLGSLTLALGMLLVTTPIAHAKDICLDLGGVVYTGKGASIPSKGKCKPWYGIANGVCASSAGSVSIGAICKTTAGTFVDITIHTTCIGGETFVDHVDLPYPSLSGGTDDFMIPDTGAGGSNLPGLSANKVDCIPSTVPIPLDSPKLRALGR